MREVDKFEKAILEFGMDAALEYFATPINLHDEFKAEWDKIKNLGERSEPPHPLLSDVDSLKDQIDTIRIKLFAHKKQAFLNNELSIEDDEITYLASAIGKLLGASENLRDYIEGIRKQRS